MPPWHLLTLVPHAALASVWPLMRPSHAGRQIREPRLPASVSNWSPQQPRSVTPISLHWSPAARSNLNVINNCKDPRLGALAPFRLLHKTTLNDRVLPSAGRFQIPRACLDSCRRPGTMSHPTAQPHPKWRCPGKPAACTLLFLAHSLAFPRLRTVLHLGGCDAPQGFETISAKPAVSAIDQSRASACADQQATAMLAPCRIGECLGMGDSHHPCLTLLAGRLARGSGSDDKANQTPLHTLYWPKKSFFGRSACHRLHGLPHIKSSLMQRTGDGEQAGLLGARPGLARRQTTSVDDKYLGLET